MSRDYFGWGLIGMRSVEDRPSDQGRIARKDGMRQVRSAAKTVVFFVITTGLSIALSFAILEFGLAKFYAETEEGKPEMSFDPTLGWKPVPGIRWTKPVHTFNAHTVSINQMGLRNREITPGMQSELKRMVLLGDSFTFAKAVRSEDIFPSLLESHLNQVGRFEVVNAGVPGYGTAQELLLMQDLINKQIVGDVYVLMFFVNDILDNLRLDYGSLEETPARPGFAIQRDGALKQVSYPRKAYSESLVPAPTGAANFVTVEVVKRQLASFVQSRPWFASLITKMGIKPTVPRMPGVINGWYRQDVLDDGVPLTKALIREIQVETRKKGADFLVSIIPSPFEVYPETYHPILKTTFPDDKSVEDYLGDQTRPQRIIGAICQELQIPFLDLLPILRSSNEKALYIPLEGHLTQEGHAVVAHQLAEFIQEHL